ncbi:MAG TPA: CYCXC family (seleno)protein, partial [Pyrinomonadaceae bacterium]|nr:CYCXC family (seleno)protein [Pyrinomonadaceae bacterium]
ETVAPVDAHDSHDAHAHGATERVPRFATSAAELKGLPTVLPASQFTGLARVAYAQVKEIPQTIAQLPCYCHCDVGFGHKSLHTCFTDDHAAHCAVCVEEALLAYKLQKEERLSPAEIRERIIAEYGAER